jgi:hypothetical protein
MVVLGTYRWTPREKDPAIDELRTVLQDEGLYEKLDIVAELAGLHKQTPKNIFHGDVLNPHSSTIEKLGRIAGWKRVWQRERKINLDEELEFARARNKREATKRAKEREAFQGVKKKRVRKKKAA